MGGSNKPPRVLRVGSLTQSFDIDRDPRDQQVNALGGFREALVHQPECVSIGPTESIGRDNAEPYLVGNDNQRFACTQRGQCIDQAFYRLHCARIKK